ncbi:hypothetical protein RUND412_000445 [Rhizina undulata]
MAAVHRRPSQGDLPLLQADAPSLSHPALETTLTAPTDQRDVALFKSNSLHIPPLFSPIPPSSPPYQNRPATPNGLRLQTTNLPGCTVTSATTIASSRPNTAAPSVNAGFSRSGSFNDSLSPASASPQYSPAMDCITKMTPLPSPIVNGDSPGPWNRFRSKSISRHPSSARPTPPRSINGSDSGLGALTGESNSAALVTQSQQRKVYNGLATPGPEPQQITSNYTPNRSAGSDYDSPASLTVPNRRDLFKTAFNNGVSSGSEEGSSPGICLDSDHGPRMQREKFLAQRRRTISSAESSPALSGSVTSLSSVSSTDTAIDVVEANNRLIKKQRLESFEAKTVPDGIQKRWRGIRLLGQGTFSKVILATSEELPEEVDCIHEESGEVVERDRIPFNPRKLVAVKVIEHGAAGGASKERVESSLKRELDILKTVQHPSLIRLKAYSIEPSRALLILRYCPGGDLFDVASDYTFTMEAPLIRRIFAEVVSAVCYLHKNGIVHRDVKLENVLINLPRAQLAEINSAPYDYPHPITTLTDVGLSRRVDFEKDPLLTTRCGSDDYASPELIMGQPYDGRQTDAWALGVMLFALMESRLPFDPPPGSNEQKMRSKTAHRIARCEWKWVKIAGPPPSQANGNLDIDVNGTKSTYDENLEGGKRIVEGLLKRASKRSKLDAVVESEWVKGAITMELKELEE